MAEQVKACAAQPDDLCLTLKRWKERADSHRLSVLCSLHVLLVCTHKSDTYTYRNHTKIKSIRKKTTCFFLNIRKL